MKRIIVNDSELSDKEKKYLASLSEEKLMDFIASNFDISYYDIHEIREIAWYAEEQTLFIKFIEVDSSYFITRFVAATLSNSKLVPLEKGSKPLSGKD